MTVVAKIDHDLLFDASKDDLFTDQTGREFHYDAMRDWWGFDTQYFPPIEDFNRLPITRFKLFDDDGELYYQGWLFNDSQGMVQSFVLKWAEYDSGCTTILVQMPDLSWKQEIG